MGTRSTIALEYADGTVGQVYCHWDGYLDHNGMILYKHYSNPFILRDLIDLGDLSSLRPEVGVAHDFDDRFASEEQCTFYGRDRGESATDAKSFKDFEDYRKNHQYEEYEYILRTDGNWYVSDHGQPYVLLADELAEQLRETAEEETLAA